MPTQDAEARLSALKARVAQATQEKARAETTLEHVKKQREEELAKLAALGVSEDELAGEIERLEALVLEKLREAEACLGESA